MCITPGGIVPFNQQNAAAQIISGRQNLLARQQGSPASIQRPASLTPPTPVSQATSGGTGGTPPAASASPASSGIPPLSLRRPPRNPFGPGFTIPSLGGGRTILGR